MPKPELGNKHICENCGIRFYDFNREVIACPKCGNHQTMERNKTLVSKAQDEVMAGVDATDTSRDSDDESSEDEDDDEVEEIDMGGEAAEMRLLKSVVIGDDEVEDDLDDDLQDEGADLEVAELPGDSFDGDSGQKTDDVAGENDD